MAVEIAGEKCIACGACVVLCPQGAIRLQNGVARVEDALCIDCLRCVCKCYARAIRPGDAGKESECFS